MKNKIISAVLSASLIFQPFSIFAMENEQPFTEVTEEDFAEQDHAEDAASDFVEEDSGESASQKIRNENKEEGKETSRIQELSTVSQAKPMSYYEYEGNDSSGSADWIGLNDSVYANLSAYDDVDWFRFTTYDAGPIWFEFAFNQIVRNDTIWRVYIYNSSMQELIERDINGNNLSTVSTKVGLSAGTYYAKVEAAGRYSHSDQQYELRINSYASSVWEKEFNDDKNNENDHSQANSLSLNKSVLGTLVSPYDKDWYKVSTNNGGPIWFEFAFNQVVRNDTIWRVYIYNSSMQVLIQKDINGNNLNTISTKVGLPAGTYYAKVEAGGRYSHSDQQYRFRINSYASSVWEKEFNDNKNNGDDHSQANYLSLNKSVLGTISDRDDKDWYQVTTYSDGPIWFEFAFNEMVRNDTIWKIHIYNSSLQELMVRDINGNSLNTVSTKVGLPAGTYYAKVEAGGRYSHSDQQYRFRINNYASSVWEKEFNDNKSNESDRSQANYLNLNRSVLGTIVDRDDKDWYRFTMSQDGTASFSFSFNERLNSNTYWRVRLYNSSMREIVAYEYQGDQLKNTSSRRRLLRGTYYLKVEAYSRYSHSDQQYMLKVNS